MDGTATKKAVSKKSKSTIAVEFEFERSTKNTHRFQEVADEPLIGTLYVQKSAFDKEPSGLVVTIEVK
jgi:hypothetical protein